MSVPREHTVVRLMQRPVGDVKPGARESNCSSSSHSEAVHECGVDGWMHACKLHEGVCVCVCVCVQHLATTVIGNPDPSAYINTNHNAYVFRTRAGTDLVAVKERCPQPADLGHNQVLLQRLFLSLDPAMRGWMRDIPSYIPPVAVGAIMRGTTISQVVASTSDQFRVGGIVKVRALLFGFWQ